MRRITVVLDVDEEPTLTNPYVIGENVADGYEDGRDVEDPKVVFVAAEWGDLLHT